MKEKMVSREIYCRSCGMQNPKSITELKEEYGNKSLHQIFLDCTGIDVRQDSFSKILCKKCRSLLMSAYTFRELVKETYERLLKQNHVEAEIKVETINEIVEAGQELDFEVKKEDDEIDSFQSNFQVFGSTVDHWSSDGIDEISYKRSRKRNKQIKWVGIQCPGCRISVRLNKDLRQHLKEMEGKEDHIWHCEVCVTDYKTKPDLYGHIVRMHKEQVCPFCSEHFVGSNDLQRHVTKAHPNEDEVQDICPHCGKLVKYLRSHIRTVHKRIKKFSCDLCNKNFVTRHGVEQHFRVHTNERPFQCSYPDCGKRFKLLCQVKQHEERHGPKQNYICDMCGLNLASKYSMIQHRKTHFNIGTFKCDECNATFGRPAYLKKHKTTQHGPPLNCPTCSRTFKEKYRLKAHMKVHESVT